VPTKHIGTDQFFLLVFSASILKLLVKFNNFVITLELKELKGLKMYNRRTKYHVYTLAWAKAVDFCYSPWIIVVLMISNILGGISHNYILLCRKRTYQTPFQERINKNIS